MHTGGYSTKQTLSEDLKAVQVVLEPAGITGNQLSLALDRAYKSYTGRSALEAAGVQLIAPTQNQLLNPTDIGQEFGISARKVNDLLAGAGYQHKIADKWEPLEPGEPYAVMQDVGKTHSKHNSPDFLRTSLLLRQHKSPAPRTLNHSHKHSSQCDSLRNYLLTYSEHLRPKQAQCLSGADIALTDDGQVLLDKHCSL